MLVQDNFATDLEEKFDYSQVERIFSKFFQAKAESWKKTCNVLNKFSHTAKLHKLLIKSHSNKLGTLIKDDGTYSKTDIETLEELAKSHFPGRSADKPINQKATNNTSTEESEEIFNDEVIKWALDSFSPFKSAGMDEIFPALLQKVKDAIIPVLKIIFIKSYAWGYIPVGKSYIHPKSRQKT